MIRSVAIGTIVLFVASLALAANAGPKDEVNAAVKKLAAAGNYSWKTTTEMAGGQFRPGPTEGKTEKGGFTMLSMTRGDNTTEVVIQGNKGAIKMADGWQSLEEMSSDQQGPGRFMARMVQTFKSPAAQAEELVGKVQDLKQADGAYAGELSEEGAKSLMMFGGRGGQNAPEISDAKGSAKFWVKDGMLVKYEYRVQGKMTFNNNEREIDRTTTTEIKDIGTTKVEVPEEAKKKIG